MVSSSSIDHAMKEIRLRRLAYPEAEAAELLGVSVRTMYQLRADGRIGFLSIGNRVVYPASSIRRFIRENETR